MAEIKKAFLPGGWDVRAKKICLFCKEGKLPVFTDTALLRRFISDRAKIVPGARSGVCAKHQRVVTKEIKYARHLSLLPFAVKV